MSLEINISLCRAGAAAVAICRGTRDSIISMTETNIGHAVLQLLGTIGGLLFIATAVRAVVIGDFTGPKGIKYGVIYGVAHIDREERPLAF